MADIKYPQLRISPEDNDWIRERAAAHRRTLTAEFTTVREIVELYERANGGNLDILPHPADAQPVPTLQPCEEVK